MKNILKLSVFLLLLLSGCVFISLPGISPLTEKEVGGKGRDKVLLIDISGLIVEEGGTARLGLETSRKITARIKEELAMAEKDERVRAVVFRINSPGGSVTTSDIVIARTQMEAGKLRVLAQLAPTRSPLMPEVPTIIEAGLSDFGVSFWNGLFAPKGTPAPIVAKLNREVNRAMASRAVAEKATAFGSEIILSTPEAFRARIVQDADLYKGLIHRNRISSE